MFLTLERFLAHFPEIVISRDSFVRRFTVQYRVPQTFSDIFDLEKSRVIKNVADQRYQNRDKIIDYFYEIVIEKRHHYLTQFYNSFFRFKQPDLLNWQQIDIRQSNAPENISLQKNDQARIMIRNLYYLEILHQTRITNTMENKTSFWQTFENLYNNLQLEGRFFAPSSIGLFLRDKTNQRQQAPQINYNNLFYLFQAYQPKASILNPYTIKWILTELFPNVKRLFTPVLSWSSYLTAFMHTPNAEFYLGVDVMPSVCQKTRFLAEYYEKLNQENLNQTQKQVEILCQASESLASDQQFMAKYSEFFDAILICPPYFNMEIYSEGEQSLKNYPDYQEWLQKYWCATVDVVHKTAKHGAYFGVIINDYCDLEGNNYNLTHDLDVITKRFFEPVATYGLYNRTSPLRQAKKDRSEKLYLYKKSDEAKE